MTTRHKYTVIIKAADDRFLKYRNVTNLLSLTSYLDDKYAGWRYFNVFDKQTHLQLASFTSKARPTARTL